MAESEWTEALLSIIGIAMGIFWGYVAYQLVGYFIGGF